MRRHADKAALYFSSMNLEIRWQNIQFTIGILGMELSFIFFQYESKNQVVNYLVYNRYPRNGIIRFNRMHFKKCNVPK